MIVQTKSLYVGYAHASGDCSLLEDLNLSIGESEIIALLGANGSGKSTLLRSLAGMQSILAGQLFINGKDTRTFSGEEWSRNVGMVLARTPDTGSLDVYGLIALGRIPYTGLFGRLKEDDHRIIAEVMEQMDLSDYAWRKVAELSDGERQRVMIARALAQQTPLVVLDEPTAFLDLSMRRKMAAKLRELAKEQKHSFVLSTHEIDLALNSATRFWIIGRDRAFYDIQSSVEAEAIIQSEFGV